MGFDVNKYAKSNKKHKFKAYVRFYNRKLRILKVIFKGIFGLFWLILLIGAVFIISFVIWDNIERKYLYSIPLPEITGRFDLNSQGLVVWGVENVVGQNTATLKFVELECYDRKCVENSISIMNLKGVFMFPYHREYEIKYIDKNKILYGGDNYSGTIDLINKTVSFSCLGGFDNKPRQIEIVTDNEKIKKLEKRIIRKYLRK